MSRTSGRLLRSFSVPRSCVRRVVVVLAATVGLLVGSAGAPVVAQPVADSVQLHLIHRVRTPGQPPHESKPPPAGTEIVVVPVAAGQSLTVPNLAPLTRDTLVQKARSIPPQALDAQGRTAARYATTPDSRRIYYVLARTPEGTLYESYVNTGTSETPRFVPGADAVLTGRMTIGPVPRAERDRMRAVFEPTTAARDEQPDTAVAEREAQPALSGTTASADTAAAAPGGTADRQDPSATAEASIREAERPPGNAETRGGGGSIWGYLWGGLVGILIGMGLGAWGQRRRSRRPGEGMSRFAPASEPTTAPESGGSPDEAGSPSAVSAEETESPPALRAANAELRAENRKLKDRLRRVKEHVRKLRSGGANRSASNSRPPAEEDADASDPEGEE